MRDKSNCRWVRVLDEVVAEALFAFFPPAIPKIAAPRADCEIQNNPHAPPSPHAAVPATCGQTGGKHLVSPRAEKIGEAEAFLAASA
jgi:hypothetical protein